MAHRGLVVSPAQAAVVGTGFSLPATVRTNDDPVFDWLHHHHTEGEGLFTGLKDRRVLAPGEDIATHMLIAAEAAIADAGLRPDEIDGITGDLSNSDYITPNGLAKVHRDLGLTRNAWVKPVDDNFTNFFTGLFIADAAVNSGRARNVLVVCGCNWSRMVDYHTRQATTAGDGAGAVVVGTSNDPSRFRLFDEHTIMDTAHYGVMYLRHEPVLPDGAPPHHQDVPIYTAPYFTLTPEGVEAFTDFGTNAPVELVQTLMGRHGIERKDLTLITYQVSTKLSGHWEKDLGPGPKIDTLAELGNMTLATTPVNFARGYDSISTDWVLMFSMNTSVGVGGILMRRNA
jgi:3-oxoacyl-[acyl-carrier-protein] synthase III